VQINFTEKESQLQKIFLKSAIGFFLFKKFRYYAKILKKEDIFFKKI